MKRLMQQVFDFFKRKFDAFLESLDESSSQQIYQKLKYYNLIIIILWIFLCVHIVGWLLTQTAYFIGQITHPNAFILLSLDDWYAPTGMLAMALCQDVFKGILTKIKGEWLFDIYNYGMLLVGSYHYPKFGRLMKELLIYVAIWIFSQQAFRITYVYEDRILRQNVLTFEQEEYAFNQIQSITYELKRLKKGDKSNGNEFDSNSTVKMKDGKTWDSYNFVRDNPSAFQFIAQKANVKIDTVLEFKK